MKFKDASIVTKPTHAVNAVSKTIKPRKTGKIVSFVLKPSVNFVQEIITVVSIKLVRIQISKSHHFLGLNASSARSPIALIARPLISVKNVLNHK